MVISSRSTLDLGALDRVILKEHGKIPLEKSNEIPHRPPFHVRLSRKRAVVDSYSCFLGSHIKASQFVPPVAPRRGAVVHGLQNLDLAPRGHRELRVGSSGGLPDLLKY